MMSVTQIAKSLGISSQAVRQRMSHFDGFLANHTKLIKHRRCVDDKGVRMIMNSKSNRNKSNSYANYNFKHGHYFEFLKNTVQYQRKQLNDRNNEIKRLTFMLGNANNRANKAQQQLLTYHQSNESKSNKKHGWLYRIFH